MFGFEMPTVVVFCIVIFVVCYGARQAKNKKSLVPSTDNSEETDGESEH